MKPVREAMLLYIVTDRIWSSGNTLSSQVEEALSAGATCVQLREKSLGFEEFLKEAFAIQAVAKKYGVPFIVNDNIEVALACGADGVHVGQSDRAASEARKQIGEGMILGVSVQTVQQAILAQQSGADYIGVGAVFATATKTDADDVSYDTLKDICASVSIPVVAIGGIHAGNILELSGSGIDGVAVVSAIFAQPDIAGATRELLELAKKTVKKYKGAIFDLDGTLIDSMPVWKSLGRTYLALQGIAPPENIAEILKPMSLLESAEYFQSAFSMPQTVDEIMAGINTLIERQYKELIPLKPGVMPFLARLRKSGVKCCIVTATDRYLAEAALLRLGILPYFDFLLTCTEEKCGKNDPGIFEKALDKLHMGKGDAVVFEDALYAVKTAKAAGFTVAGVYDASAASDAEKIQNMADYYIGSFEEWEARL